MTILSAPCAISPVDEQRQARFVGDDLVKHHGKRKLAFHLVMETHGRTLERYP